MDVFEMSLIVRLEFATIMFAFAYIFRLAFSLVDDIIPTWAQRGAVIILVGVLRPDFALWMAVLTIGIMLMQKYIL